jgi:hypothetical protein
MRYVNLVPEPSRKARLSGVEKYQQYLDKNIEYRNRPDRKQFMKDYYTEYRKEHEGQVQCDCGAIVKQLSMYAHIKTNKHLNYIENASS